jgi:hypothetical protein
VCGGRSVIFYCCSVAGSIAIECQSVWAHTRSEWVDSRSVVRTGRWDNGEISSHLLQFTGAEGFPVRALRVSTVTSWVEVMERRKCGVTFLETARGSWSVCLCGGSEIAVSMDIYIFRFVELARLSVPLLGLEVC